MRVPSILLLSVALLSGCANGGTDAPDPTIPAPGPDSASTLPTFAQPQVVATVPNTEHEAFVAVAPDGRTLLTCAHGDFKRFIHMFASSDGGATWDALDAGPAMPPAGDCEIALGPGGAWSFAGKTELGVSVATTTDQGMSWTVNHLAAPPTNGLADRQWLAYAGDVLLLTYQPGTQSVGPVLLTRSMDLGATWSDPLEVAGIDPSRPMINAGDLLVSADNTTIYVPVARSAGPQEGASSRLSMLVSKDAGATWAEKDVGMAPGTPYPSGAALGPGGLFWAYGEDDLVFVTSTDQAETWSEPVRADGTMAWSRPWASARPDGTFDVVWLRQGTGGNATSLALTRIAPTATEPVVTTVSVAPVDFIEFAAVAHDAAGRAHIMTVDAPSKLRGDVGTDLDGDVLYVQELAP